MNTFALPSSTATRRTVTAGVWLLRIGLGAQFVLGGAAKLAADAQMVTMFEDIGAGQWLRLLVGVLEVAGGIGLLAPRLSRYAAAGLVALMTGAAVTNVVALGTAPTLPLVFGVLAGVLAAVRR